MHQDINKKIVDKHIALLSRLSEMTKSGITLYDNFRKKHVYTSYNFTQLFGYNMDNIMEDDIEYFNRHIHPDDIADLERNGKAAMEYFSLSGRTVELAYTKMLNEYRIMAGGRYVRVIEQYQVLEFTDDGNVWLTLSVLDVSPNQSPLGKVRSKLMNCKTGEIFLLKEFDGGLDEESLSPREKTILKLVKAGKLSKEISDELQISVPTVNTHRQRILKKLNANNTVEALNYAGRLGLLE